MKDKYDIGMLLWNAYVFLWKIMCLFLYTLEYCVLNLAKKQFDSCGLKKFTRHPLVPFQFAG